MEKPENEMDDLGTSTKIHSSITQRVYKSINPIPWLIG
jgi:hypothetical protein